MMTPTYYWKALHIPSGEYLLNSITGSILHTNPTGSKWQRKPILKEILKRKLNKFVKGPLTIKFDLEDWELQQFVVTLRKSVKLHEPKTLHRRG